MKASTFRGAIFDLDGTLADPLVDISNSMNRVLDYKDNCLNETRLCDGISEIPDRVGKAKHQNSRITQGWGLYQTIVAALLGGRKFAAVIGGRPGIPAEPDHTGALEISGIFGTPPADIMHLGDSGIDMVTATSASGGMFAVGVTWGFRTRDELLKNGAQILLDIPASWPRKSLNDGHFRSATTANLFSTTGQINRNKKSSASASYTHPYHLRMKNVCLH